MKSQLTYQQLFQSLKGVQAPILTSFVLPVIGTEYTLSPINCSEKNIDLNVVKLLTHARNANSESFLTLFNATVERTKVWLMDSVASDKERILFVLRNNVTGDFYGYMGIAYGNKNESYIEADSVVRTNKNVLPGLMKKAFQRMLSWIHLEVGISQVWVRVISDNSAVNFYRKCGFVIQKNMPLYEVLNFDGRLIEFSIDSLENSRVMTQRRLLYMKLE